MRSGFVGAAAISLFVCVLPARASWLSDITGIDVNVPEGKISINQPRPQDIPQMIQHLPRDSANFFLNPLGPKLAFLIRQAHAQAEPSSQPIPQNIRSILAPYFPSRILDIAKYTTTGRSGVSIATGVMEANGHVAAMTVDNIIVFRDDGETRNWSTWAHELVHVSQYQNMGIDGFAAMYAGWGAQTIENDAYSWQNHVEAEVNSSQASSASQQWFDAGPPNRQLSWNDFHAAALQVIPPQQCAQLNQIAPTAVIVQNSCGIPLLITGVQVNGMMTSCFGPVCYCPPNSQHVIQGPPGAVGTFTFVFAP